MLELVVSVGIAAASVIGVFFIKRTMEATIENVKVDALTFYAKEKQDLIENMPKLMESFGDMMFQKIKGSIGGMISGQVRLDQGLQNALTDDLLHAGNPLLAGILDQFPAAKKFVAKNPNALPQIMQLLGGFMQPGQGQGLNQTRVPDRLRSMRY